MIGPIAKTPPNGNLFQGELHADYSAILTINEVPYMKLFDILRCNKTIRQNMDTENVI